MFERALRRGGTVVGEEEQAASTIARPSVRSASRVRTRGRGSVWPSSKTRQRSFAPRRTNLRAREYDFELAPTGEAALTIAARKHPTSSSSISACRESKASRCSAACAAGPPFRSRLSVREAETNDLRVTWHRSGASSNPTPPDPATPSPSGDGLPLRAGPSRSVRSGRGWGGAGRAPLTAPPRPR